MPTKTVLNNQTTGNPTGGDLDMCWRANWKYFTQPVKNL